MSEEALYKSEKVLREAKSNALSVDVISKYARELNRSSSVVSDLKHAHEADSENYSDEEYSDLGSLVSQLMTKAIENEGMNAYEARMSGKFSALSDFNGWYLEKVVYGNFSLEVALSEYIKMSPFVSAREA
jgi:hypothetical protein